MFDSGLKLDSIESKNLQLQGIGEKSYRITRQRRAWWGCNIIDLVEGGLNNRQRSPDT